MYSLILFSQIHLLLQFCKTAYYIYSDQGKVAHPMKTGKTCAVLKKKTKKMFSIFEVAYVTITLLP